jgi:hypothetical protein
MIGGHLDYEYRADNGNQTIKGINAIFLLCACFLSRLLVVTLTPRRQL